MPSNTPPPNATPASSPEAFTHGLRPLETRLGHTFVRPELLAAALTHRSFTAEAPGPAPRENQRLEFLGDAVLGVIVAEWLMLHCPDWQEGTLTKVRSRLTNADTFARVAATLHIGKFLRLGRGEERNGGRAKAAILADALEAIAGALWLDGGPDPVRRLFENEFADERAIALADGADINPKGNLQEWLQQRGLPPPIYDLIEESGPPHARLFRISVRQGDLPIAHGEGPSKRAAEAAAATAALLLLRTRSENTATPPPPEV